MPDPAAEGNIVATGGCLCGDVRYSVTGRLRDIVACYCGQCRKTSGNHVAATSAKDADLEIHDRGSLSWYRSSAQARRGFCKHCGSNLFWKHELRDATSIMAGTLEPPTRLKISRHIYVADASDFHAFAPDDVIYPQHD